MASWRKRWATERAQGARTFVWDTINQNFDDFEKLELNRQARVVDVGAEQDQGEVLLEVLSKRAIVNKPKLKLSAKN